MSGKKRKQRRERRQKREEQGVTVPAKGAGRFKGALLALALVVAIAVVLGILENVKETLIFKNAGLP